MAANSMHLASLDADRLQVTNQIVRIDIFGMKVDVFGMKWGNGEWRMENGVGARHSSPFSF